MERSTDRYRPSSEIDFFISYSPVDEAWAVWIAWELEDMGYQVMLQAWDFVPGSNFIEFMDYGVTHSSAVIAVLSERYLESRYGRMEWQAALRLAPHDPETRLITVRIEECELVGLLSTITFVDLVDIGDRARARDLLRQRIRQALDGRAKPKEQPRFPPHFAASTASTASARSTADPVRTTPEPAAASRHHDSLRGGDRVPFPPADLEARRCTVLHIAGPCYEKAHTGSGAGRHDAEQLVLAMARAGLPPTPDLVVISGNLTQTGSIREFDEAFAFVTGLRDELMLPHHRLALVPGQRDITAAASLAYFANCEADQVEPRPPYWPKWRHYTRFFSEIYASVDSVQFSEAHPWSLFAVPELRLVVAGLNSTIAGSHRPSDHYGWIGAEQTRWFAERLRAFGAESWLRIGLMSHPPQELRDSDRVRRALRDTIAAIVHGPQDDSVATGSARGTKSLLWRTVSATYPGQASIITFGIDPGGHRITVDEVSPVDEPTV